MPFSSAVGFKTYHRVAEFLKFTTAFLLFMSAIGCQSLSHLIKDSGSKKDHLVIRNLWTRQTTQEDNIQFRSYLLAAPVLYKDLVIVANSYDSVAAFGRSEGQREWFYPTLLGSDSGLALFEDNLVFVTNQGELICLDPNNGKKKWAFTINAEGFSTPLIRDQKVFVMSSDGRLFAVGLENGQQIWSLARISETNLSTRAAASLTADSQALYAAFPNGSVLSLTFDKGTPNWEAKIPGGLRFKDVDTKPLIIDQKVIVSGFESGVHALDLKTGQNVWTNEVTTYQSLVPFENALLVSDLKGSLYKLEIETGAVTQTFQLGHSPLGLPLVLNKNILVSESGGPIRLIDGAQGKILSSFGTGHGVSAPLAYDTEDNSFYAISQSSNLYKFEIRQSQFGKVWSWEN